MSDTKEPFNTIEIEYRILEVLDSVASWPRTTNDVSELVTELKKNGLEITIVGPRK
jgi:hypothetical protein